MPKLKYYNDTQKLEGKQIAALESQIKRKITLLKSLGGKCNVCGQEDKDLLVVSLKGLFCANCLQKHNAEEARSSLASRKANLVAMQLASWQQGLKKAEEQESKEQESDLTPTQHTLHTADIIKKALADKEAKRRKQEAEWLAKDQQYAITTPTP